MFQGCLGSFRAWGAGRSVRAFGRWRAPAAAVGFLNLLSAIAQGPTSKPLTSFVVSVLLVRHDLNTWSVSGYDQFVALPTPSTEIRLVCNSGQGGLFYRVFLLDTSGYL